MLDSWPFCLEQFKFWMIVIDHLFCDNERNMQYFKARHKNKVIKIRKEVRVSNDLVLLQIQYCGETWELRNKKDYL